MTGRAGTIAAAGMIQPDAIVQRHIKQRLFLAVILVRQFAMLEGDGLPLGKVICTVFSPGASTVAVPAP
jgi:hypothetical protein